MISTNQRQEFIKDVILYDLLDDAVTWIGNNLAVEEVFSREDLEEWAIDNGYSKIEE